MSNEDAILRLVQLFMQMVDDGEDLGRIGSEDWEELFSEIDVKVSEA